MKKNVFFLLLFCVFSYGNAQNINTKYLQNLLEIPYSNINSGLQKLKILGCIKENNEIVKKPNRVEKYYPFVCNNLSQESLSFTVYKTQFVAIENLYFPKDYYQEILEFLEENYVLLPEQNNKWDAASRVFRSKEKYTTLSRNKDYIYVTLSITHNDEVSIIANVKY